MKILNFPDFRQTYKYDCGAKAMQAVLAYYGIDTNESEVMKIAKTNKSGTAISNLKKAAKQYHLKITAKHLTIAEIKNYIDKKIPVIIPLQAWREQKQVDWEKDWRDGHYVIAIGYDKNKLYFEDPASILRTYLTFPEFEKRWHDIDNKNKKYIHYGLAIYGRKPQYHLGTAIHMN